MNYSKILVKFTAIVFFVYGVLFALMPVTFMQLVAKVEIEQASAIIDISATYGGMSIGVGIILWLLAKKAETLLIGLQSTFALMCGMAGVRLFAIIATQEGNNTMYVYLALEVAAALAAFILIKQTIKKEL